MMKNEVLFDPKVKSPRNKGYDALKELLCRAFIEKKVVTKKDLFECYKNHVATGKGWVTRWNPDKERTVYQLEEWGTWNWEVNFNNWFPRALGRLITRGELKVIPNISFEEQEKYFIESPK